MKFLLQMGVDQFFYLDGYDGTSKYEWTQDKKTGMVMSLDHAERMLDRVKDMFPDALLLEA